MGRCYGRSSRHCRDGSRTRRPSRTAHRGGAGCDGYAGAHWATRGPVDLRPQQARPGLLWGSLWEPPGTFEGSPGLPCGTRVAAISVPSQSLASRSAEASHHALSPLTGSGSATIAGASPLPVGSGLPDLGPSRPTFQAPVACTWEADAHATSRRNRRRATISTASDTGDKVAHRRCQTLRV
jgi:hypothetical protein